MAASKDKDHDPQRRALYALEAHEFGGHFRHKVPMRIMRHRAKLLARIYQVPRLRSITIRSMRGDGGEYDTDTFRLKLCPRVGRNLTSLAHEFAHHIVFCRHGNRPQDHGPLFVLYYAQCLSTLRLVPVAGFRAGCKRWKVRMANWRKVRWHQVDPRVISRV